MKKSFLAAAVSMLGIMVIRILLSINVGEHTAEIFTNVSLTALFLFFLILASRKKNNREQ